MSDIADLESTGLEVVELRSHEAFKARRLPGRDTIAQMERVCHLAQAFVERPETILQEFANAAVELCGADSAGISIQEADDHGNLAFRWVATAGEFASFRNAVVPNFPSVSGICLQRGHAQVFRISQRFLDLVGIPAKPVTDGLVFPWKEDQTRGTLWVMAHARSEAFDADDARLVAMLANFAAVAVREERQRKLLLKQAKAAAAAAMANDLAHRINNPLQSLTNLVYIAGQDCDGARGKELAHEMKEHVGRLSDLVRRLLALPVDGQS